MSRARKSEKNELIKLVKEINRRMGDFEDSVQKLQDLKDSLEEVDDSLAQQATINRSKMERMNKDFEDNKIRAVHQAAKEIGKVIIPQEDLDELRRELAKVKETGQQEVERQIAMAQERFDEKLEQAINVKQLQHDCETAQLRASIETHQKEVETLRDTLDRMSEELKSQKQLTAEVAGMSRKTNDRASERPRDRSE